jgi:hypothetical protein
MAVPDDCVGVQSAAAPEDPNGGRVMKDGAIVAIAEVGGLHHRYERVAA